MAEMAGRMQAQFKKSSGDLFLFIMKTLSGLVLGLTFALIFEVILGHAEGENILGFVFVVLVTTGIFMRIAKTWGVSAVFVFDLICILAGMLLKLYIMVAPDA